VAPHTGDLEDLRTFRAFETNLAHLERLLALEPRLAAHDLHPGYLSTQFAVRHFPGERQIAVQHHHAHVASCAAEAGITGPFIGVAYDGLGLGDDGTFWGGEVFLGDLAGYRRVGRFALAPMPGGAMAVRKPYRMALGYLFGLEQDIATMRPEPGPPPLPDIAASFLARLDPREVDVVRTQVGRGLNSPQASSAGRLFDAVSSLLGIRDVVEYEAQAAIELEMHATPTDPEGPCSAVGALAVEAAAEGAHVAVMPVGTLAVEAAAEGARAAALAGGDGLRLADGGTRARRSADATLPLPYRLVPWEGLLVYDPQPTIAALLGAASAGVPASTLAARFQETIAEVTRELCAAARTASGIGRVCLSGGVFQNRWLATALLARLSSDGFEVFINRRVPVNDGGISYGQAAVAAARLASGTPAGVAGSGA
jgi:hydrogenase maturation protein HypF